ncbi:MAG: GHMP kinase [Flavobacteriales bacterium]|nr:GHMP kinase [Flavobacteriales bacterium]
MSTAYYACGKLLITGEYLVLRGARGLALPTSKGQHLTVHSHSDQEAFLEWRSVDESGKIWFEARFDPALNILGSTDRIIADRLGRILHSARDLNPAFLSHTEGVHVQTDLEFDRSWGLGSSSSLIASIAQWAEVDSYDLLQSGFGGSGYDVMVALARTPILYQLEESRPKVDKVVFDPPFHESLWFVHTGKKEDSRQAIQEFSDISVSQRDIEHISTLSSELVDTTDLDSFIRILREHDLLLSRILARPTAMEEHSTYSGGYVKYLGAWGGDFMLVTGAENDLDHFRSIGMDTIVPFKEMIRL